MIYVYTARHAPRMQFCQGVSDLETGLSPAGQELAKKEMGPALRKDIDAVISKNPGKDYAIEVVYAPSARTEQTKDALVDALKGLRNITVREEPLFGHSDLGGFFGLSSEERQKKSSYAYMLEAPGFQQHTFDDFLTGMITGGSTKQDVLESVNTALRPYKLESSKERAPLQFRVFVGHSLSCQSMRCSMSMDSFGNMLSYERVPPGAIRRFHGETMHIMHDDGVVFKGSPEKAGSHQGRAR